MDLVTTIVGSVPAVNSTLNLVDRVAKLYKQGSNIEAQEAVLELRRALLDLGQENLVLRNENLSQQQEIVNLKNAAFVKQQLKFDKPNYYLDRENGERDGPFCQVCKDKEDKLIRLQEISSGYWYCLACKSKVATKEAKEARAKTNTRRVVNAGNSLNGPNSWMR
jgi:ribosomal protein L37AE/L43A